MHTGDVRPNHRGRRKRDKLDDSVRRYQRVATVIPGKYFLFALSGSCPYWRTLDQCNVALLTRPRNDCDGHRRHFGSFYPCRNCLLPPGGTTCEATCFPHRDTQTLDGQVSI